MFIPISRRMDKFAEATEVLLLALRLASLSALVVLLTMHVRSVRVFRWEQSVSGGVYVTYVIAMAGLALCAGTHTCKSKILQAYICGVGAVLLVVNAGMIWHRWKYANELTRAVTELLGALGLPVRRQIRMKATISLIVALLLLIDLGYILYKSNSANS